jgi:hypothetical protein
VVAISPGWLGCWSLAIRIQLVSGLNPSPLANIAQAMRAFLVAIATTAFQ